MDATVDLTRYNYFSKRHSLQASLNPFGLVFKSRRYPWDREEYGSKKSNNPAFYENVYICGHDRILFSGSNNNSNNIKAEYLEAEEGVRCFCCGIKHSILSGDVLYFGLCEKCARNLDNKDYRRGIFPIIEKEPKSVRLDDYL